MNLNLNLLFKLVCIFIVLSLSACAATQVKEGSEPAKRTIDDVLTEGEDPALVVHDPWEGYNRWMYNFNAKFDRYIFLPVVGAYTTILPSFARTGVRNFFRNLGEFRNITNALLQGRPVQSSRSLGRLAVNTTIGIAGLFDPATKFGMFYQKEDFGQTLGVWGVGPGPFLVLPILGPSTLRDAPSLIPDSAIHPVYKPFPWLIELNDEELIAMAIVEGIDTRSRIGFRYYGMGSPYEYLWVRNLWLEYRQLQIEK